MTEEELTWWTIAVHHEAGHAVACLVIWKATADIFLRRITEVSGRRTLWPSFRAGELVKEKMFIAPPIEMAIVCGAGAQAEQLFQGNDESEGFATDLLKINSAITIAEAKGRKEDAKAAIAERDSGYPETQTLLSKYSRALKAIVAEALQVSSQMEAAGTLVTDAVILSGARVRELFEANPPDE